MNLSFISDDKQLERDFREIYTDFAMTNFFERFNITAEKGNRLKVTKHENEICIFYSIKAEFYRGLSLAYQNCALTDFRIENSRAFDDISLMVDCSRNAVMNMDNFKKITRILALMGYTSIGLYMEDLYEIKEEPYFGHLRGRYSHIELKEMEKYAERLGITVVPCIQTLAHLQNIFIWPRFEEHIYDIKDILLIDSDETYDFIENMFKNLRLALKSKRINIGFDEAHFVGRGTYQDINGYKDKYTLLFRHLNKVLEIAKKYDFDCSMWSDMFFRLAYNGEYYPKPDAKSLPTDVADNIPDVELIYWDYYHVDEKIYDNMIQRHKSLQKPIRFAAGAWKWLGFAPMNSYGLDRLIPGIQSAKRNKIQNVSITAWGDNGNEASLYSVLPQIITFAEYCYTDNPTKNMIDMRLRATANASYYDFIELDAPNQIYPESKFCLTNPSKFLVYNDPLMGLYDYHVKDGYNLFYKKTANRLKLLAKRNPAFSYLFKMEETLCDFLSSKAELGNNIRNSYLNNDKANLLICSTKILPICIKKLENFCDALRTLWKTENKIYGLDSLQLKLGGQKERLYEAKRRITEYLDGTIANIEELEQPVLSFSATYDGNENLLYKHNYRYMATPNFSDFFFK